MAEFPCDHLPSNLNPWWIQTPAGVSPCILGYPMYTDNCTLANCVGWAWGRYQQIHGSIDSRLPTINAGGWFNLARSRGMNTGSEPALGAVICFSGHVAIVEEIAADGSYIRCSESDWGGPVFSYRTRYRSQNWQLTGGNRFQGFIYNTYEPGPGPGPEPPVPPGPDPDNHFKWWFFKWQILRKKKGGIDHVQL